MPALFAPGFNFTPPEQQGSGFNFPGGIKGLAALGLGAGAAGTLGLGLLRGREQQRQFDERKKIIGEFSDKTLQDIRNFENAGTARIAAQSADIVSQSQRRSHAVAANLARTGGGTLASKLTAGVRASGAKAKVAHEARAFPALGEVVATRRQAVRQQTMQLLAQLGARPNMGNVIGEQFASGIGGIASLYENINKANA